MGAVCARPRLHVQFHSSDGVVPNFRVKTPQIAPLSLEFVLSNSRVAILKFDIANLRIKVHTQFTSP